MPHSRATLGAPAHEGARDRRGPPLDGHPKRVAGPQAGTSTASHAADLARRGRAGPETVPARGVAKPCRGPQLKPSSAGAPWGEPRLRAPRSLFPHASLESDSYRLHGKGRSQTPAEGPCGTVLFSLQGLSVSSRPRNNDTGPAAGQACVELGNGQGADWGPWGGVRGTGTCACAGSRAA